MVHYKLTYFNGRGLGELSRQIFVLAGQEYEDNRVEFEDWPALKEGTPFGQLPVLEEDGKILAQSFAIARYLARKFGFAGKTDFEQAQVDAFADQFKDFSTEIRPFMSVFFGFAEGDLEKLKEEVFKPAIIKHFGLFEKAIKDAGHGYLVGDSLTWVDLCAAEFVAQLIAKEPTAVDHFPSIKALQEKVHAVPELKKWRETRPETKF